MLAGLMVPELDRVGTGKKDQIIAAAIGGYRNRLLGKGSPAAGLLRFANDVARSPGQPLSVGWIRDRMKLPIVVIGADFASV